MHVVFITPETAPYSQSGALANVTGSLPRALAQLGHMVTVLSPYYRETKQRASRVEGSAAGAVPVGTELIRWQLLTLPEETCPQGGGRIRHGFILCDRFFDRNGIYGDERGEYRDACARFIFFSRAALAAAQALGRPVDVYHCHDWQTAPVSAYLRLTLQSHPFHGDAACLFTIHNLAYQGQFWHWDWPLLNLPWSHYNWRELEFYGKINFLKGGLIYADLLNTLSPTYSQEIQAGEPGCGLDGVLAERREDLYGVAAGLDYAHWNPAADPLLPARYSASDLSGKRQCREALAREMGLAPLDERTPILGFIGRLNARKGVDLILQSAEGLLRRGARLVFLGEEDKDDCAARVKRLHETAPERIGVAIGRDERLARLILAGSDALLMPSMLEPTGQMQLCALRYGAVPIARRTGVLADTVIDVSEAVPEDQTTTGFLFNEFRFKDFAACADRALTLFFEQPESWRKLRAAGMAQDWSWTRSAMEYEKLYLRARAKAAARRKRG